MTLHVPETPQTKWMIGAAQLAKMRDGAMLINAARGTVVDIDALAASLKSGHFSGAAIDVFPVEPKGNNDQFVSPLIGMDNVILTPHVGGSTLEAQDNIGIEVAAKLVRYSDNGSTLSAVNFPEVSLPGHPAASACCTSTTTCPGMLSRINEIFSRENINIDAQYPADRRKGRLRRHRRLDVGRTRRRTQGRTRRNPRHPSRKSLVLISQEAHAHGAKRFVRS